ncbi:MAG: rod shape-determining protein [Aquificota bacterium]|nr:MAG: rod shape-determining protein [Aquificota bacterium]
MLSSLIGIFSNDIGIDLGTANTLVFVKGKGIVLTEPSIVAKDLKRNKALAVGHEAKAMMGKTPDYIEVIRPLKDGVIADFEITQDMLKYFIKKVHKHLPFFNILRPRPRVIVGVPSGITEVEKRAVVDAVRHAGARDVYLIAEPMAAAIGAGLPITEPGGNMIVDIGGGTTEIAVISLSGMVVSHSVRVAGDEMNEAVIQYLKRHHGIVIGEQTAEKIKIKLGSAYPSEKDMEEMEIGGVDITNSPISTVIRGEEIRKALSDVVDLIVNAVKTALEKTPPELGADLVERGIVLAGGGSMLYGLDIKLREEINLPVFRAEDPLTAVARGIGKALDDINLIKRISMD